MQNILMLEFKFRFFYVYFHQIEGVEFTHDRQTFLFTLYIDLTLCYIFVILSFVVNLGYYTS